MYWPRHSKTKGANKVPRPDPEGKKTVTVGKKIKIWNS